MYDYEYNQEFCDEETYGENGTTSTLDNLSVSSSVRKQYKTLNSFKMLDGGFHKVKRKVDGKMVKIEYYHSGMTPGSRIRNAITGMVYPHYKIGSLAENLFFKVTNATADENNKQPFNMFFENPDQYERHFKTTVSQDIKENWQRKHDIEWKIRNK
jgi:hypothetical protein